ncbi:hypothetical protein SDC9_183583 [bioreactor metagenome]|uniref:Uncharacterized protein n=1 Tax=bioreactor metagenome TaxID=1076179 RepID=A0A645HAM6_9ZZZZ
MVKYYIVAAVLCIVFYPLIVSRIKIRIGQQQIFPETLFCDHYVGSPEMLEIVEENPFGVVKLTKLCTINKLRIDTGT